MLEVGRVFRFKVLRQSDLGYVLGNDVDSVLLHMNQACGKKLKPNDVVEAFIQYDSKGRITATLEKPSITLGNPGFAEYRCDRLLIVEQGLHTGREMAQCDHHSPSGCVDIFDFLCDGLYAILAEIPRGRGNENGTGRDQCGV